jgi:hypothetical protein
MKTAVDDTFAPKATEFVFEAFSLLNCFTGTHEMRSSAMGTVTLYICRESLLKNNWHSYFVCTSATSLVCISIFAKQVGRDFFFAKYTYKSIFKFENGIFTYLRRYLRVIWWFSGLKGISQRLMVVT